MAIDFVDGSDVKAEVIKNGDGSAVLRLSRADGTASSDVVGVRPDGTYQRFSVAPATATLLGIVLDASGRVKEVS